MEFSDAMKIFRKKKGLTQLDLAKELGLTRVTLANYELQIQEPSLSRAMHIAKLLDFSLADLIFTKLSLEERKEKTRLAKVAKLQAELSRLLSIYD